MLLLTLFIYHKKKVNKYPNLIYIGYINQYILSDIETRTPSKNDLTSIIFYINIRRVVVRK